MTDHAAVIDWTPAENEAFRTWLHAPLSLAELLRIELAESCRQFGFTEATEHANALMDETDEQAMWREIGAQADLAILAEAAPNPYPEPMPAAAGIPPITALIRAA